MANYENVIKAVETFDRAYKRPAIDDLPSKLTYVIFENSAEWERLWSDGGALRMHAEDPCVYFFFDDNKELLYIGKADILGKRFYQHFSQTNAEWNGKVNNLAILPLPKESWFETFAIEAYLIRELKPPCNKVGK